MFKRIAMFSAAAGLGLAVWLVVWMTTAAGPRPIESVKPQDLIAVRVEGTTIDLVPSRVDLVANSPAVAVEKLIAAGGERNKGDVPHSAYFRGILYIFGTPEQWNKGTNYTFADGDVIYTYCVQSHEERAAFETKYKLTKALELEGVDGFSPPLYRSSPGFYVIIMSLETVFACAMQCEFVPDDVGACPKCRMDLFPIEVYR